MGNHSVDNVSSTTDEGTGASKCPAGHRTDPVRGRVSAPSSCTNATPGYVNDVIDDQVSARGIVFFRVPRYDKRPGHFRGSSFCKGRVRRRLWRGESAGPEPMRAGWRERET